MTARLFLMTCLSLMTASCQQGTFLDPAVNRMAVEKKYPSANVVTSPRSLYRFLAAVDCEVRYVELMGKGVEITSDTLLMRMPDCVSSES